MMSSADCFLIKFLKTIGGIWRWIGIPTLTCRALEMMTLFSNTYGYIQNEKLLWKPSKLKMQDIIYFRISSHRQIIQECSSNCKPCPFTMLGIHLSTVIKIRLLHLKKELFYFLRCYILHHALKCYIFFSTITSTMNFPNKIECCRIVTQAI